MAALGAQRPTARWRLSAEHWQEPETLWRAQGQLPAEPKTMAQQASWLEASAPGSSGAAGSLCPLKSHSVWPGDGTLGIAHTPPIPSAETHHRDR